jgi:hypothetical protein
MNWCPYPASTDPAVVLERVVPLAREITKDSVAAWVAEQNALGHCCACGCGERIEVQPSHRRNGVPRFFGNHHRQARKGCRAATSFEGMLSVRKAAEVLGVGEWVLRHLDAAQQVGTVHLGARFYSPADLDALRGPLAERVTKRKTPPAGPADMGRARPERK